jgi:tetratricopeptide (TPR) repeat protein
MATLKLLDPEFGGRTVTLIGRLAAFSVETVSAAVTLRGGVVRRGMPRRGGLLVVGRRAFSQLDDGRLRRKLQLADEVGAACISERMLLDRLGLLPARPHALGVIALEDLPAKSRLDLNTLRFLILFDLIRPEADRCSFQDLVATREVRRLLNEGAALSEIIAGATRAQRRPDIVMPGPAGALLGDDQPLARLKLVSDEYGRIVSRVGTLFADLDGQLRLPLPDAGNPSVDELFEAAEEAEQLKELSVAATLYRRCIALDRHDPIAPFNLANVLREQGDIKDAVFHLRMALGIDPHFAEAWYNLALIMDEQAEPMAAQEGFERAIAADPYYADPIYNLAQLHFDRGDYTAAAELWQRYLELDPDSQWGRRARYGLALCRRHGALSPRPGLLRE